MIGKSQKETVSDLNSFVSNHKNSPHLKLLAEEIINHLHNRKKTMKDIFEILSRYKDIYLSLGFIVITNEKDFSKDGIFEFCKLYFNSLKKFDDTEFSSDYLSKSSTSDEQIKNEYLKFFSKSLQNLLLELQKSVDNEKEKVTIYLEIILKVLPKRIIAIAPFINFVSVRNFVY